MGKKMFMFKGKEYSKVVFILTNVELLCSFISSKWQVLYLCVNEIITKY